MGLFLCLFLDHHFQKGKTNQLIVSWLALRTEFIDKKIKMVDRIQFYIYLCKKFYNIKKHEKINFSQRFALCCSYR